MPVPNAGVNPRIGKRNPVTLVRTVVSRKSAVHPGIRFEIVIDGSDVIKLNPQGLRELRRYKVSMVFQNFGLLPHQTVLDNTAYALRTRGA